MSSAFGGRGAAALVLALPLGLPVAFGLAGTLRLALGGSEGALDAFARLLSWPGLPRAAALSLAPGLAATVLSLGLAYLVLALWADRPPLRLLRRLIGPLLALPHAAAALGIAFLIAPSGWIARALSPWATGWQVPPDLLTLHDPMALALTLALVAKEFPFLLLMALAAWPQIDAPQRRLVMASLGHGRVAGFAIALAPPLYRRLRLPVLAVLAYGMTTVDMGQILGPQLPPPLSVQAVAWLTGAGLQDRALGAAAALGQLALVGLGLVLWRGVEGAAALALRRIAATGARGRVLDAPLGVLAGLSAGALVGLMAAGLLGLALWSLAGPWPFPAALPESLSLETWARAAPDLSHGVQATLALGVAAAGFGVLLAILWLHLAGGPPGGEAALYLPLILPQVAFLPGLQTAFLWAGLSGGLATVLLAHLVFVAPYVLLSLAPAWRALDPRLDLAAAALGAGPVRRLVGIRLPMLMAPLLTAAAVGFAVSVGQYLPTLLAGGGRVETVTTAAVALSSGGNRRLVGAYGLLQMLLPALAFALAMALPRLIYRNRAAMRGA